MAALIERISWQRCDCCGGDLPLVDFDNGSPELPESPTGGECPGHVTAEGNCGCYADATLAAWLADAAGALEEVT